MSEMKPTILCSGSKEDEAKSVKQLLEEGWEYQGGETIIGLSATYDGYGCPYNYSWNNEYRVELEGLPGESVLWATDGQAYDFYAMNASNVDQAVAFIKATHDADRYHEISPYVRALGECVMRVIPTKGWDGAYTEESICVDPAKREASLIKGRALVAEVIKLSGDAYVSREEYYKRRYGIDL